MSVTKTTLQLSSADEAFLGALMVYQIEGRYPAFHPDEPDKKEVDAIIERTKTLLTWLKKKL